MSRILAYTSPARGHLFPVLGLADQLVRRGHDIEIVTLADAVADVRAKGLSARPMDPHIEQREMDDWKASTSLGALKRSVAAFADRAPLEIADLQAAIDDFGPDALIVDTNTWGAQAVAEASGLPWAVFQPYFTPLPGTGVPPFGPGLAPMSGVVGRMRDRTVGALITGQLERTMLPSYNSVRATVGVPDIQSIGGMLTTAPLVLYFTVADLEYPRSEWPDSFRFVGPALGGPTHAEPEWLKAVDRPIVLVSCSSEHQNDRSLVETALAALPSQGYFVVASTASHDPESFDVPEGSAVVRRFLPHDAILPHTTAVICHGGMGISQRAISHGVPLVVVPFGRDQLEVARRMQHAGVGITVNRRRLTAATLTDALHNTEKLTDRTRSIAEQIQVTQQQELAADAVQELLESHVDRNT